MATDDKNLNLQLAENIFKAIDVIATNRLEKIKFDKTITCQIIDADNSTKGEYLVSDGSSTFLAYSENPSYSEDTWVYVTVPNGDFNQQKLIVGKYVSDNTEYSTYINPLDSYLDFTGNLIDKEIDNSGLIANSGVKEVVLWQTGQMSLTPHSPDFLTPNKLLEKLQKQIEDLNTQYENARNIIKSNTSLTEEEQNTQLNILEQEYWDTINSLSTDQEDLVNEMSNDVSALTQQLSQFNRLGIQASFHSRLNKYNVVSGHYGLKLNIITMDPGSTSTVKTYNCTTVNLDTDDMFGNPYNFEFWTQQQYVFDISELNNIIGMQLIFYQNDDFIDQNKKLIPGYSQLPTEIPNINSEGYDEYITLQSKWDAYLSMSNIFVKDIHISLGYDIADFDKDTLFLYSFEPLTYASYLTDSIRSILENEDLNLNDENDTIKALALVNKKNLHLRWVHVDADTGIQAIETLDSLDTWSHIDVETNTVIIEPKARIHWYQWVLNNEIEDELAGAFWKEINLNELYNDNNNINTYDWFDWEGFIPDPTLSTEKIKVIIEYPCREYLEYEFQNTVEDYLESKESDFKQEIINQNFPGTDSATTYDENNLYHKTLVNNLLDVKLKEEKESYHVSLLGNTILYTSPELIFSNEQEVPNQASIDTIRGLQLFCDEDGLQGTYYIYNADGQIINAGDASTKRILSAEFNALIVKNDEIDNKAQKIRWYFPVNNTMIELPTTGCEYIALPDSLKTEIVLTENELNVLTPEEQQARLELLQAEREAAIQEFLYNNQNNSIYADFAGLVDNNQWFCIEREGIVSSTDRPAGSIVPTAFEQIFRIKPYYTQTAVNNTVRCELYKDNKTYSAEYTLYFGTSGANGTDYTLTASFEEGTLIGFDENQNKIYNWTPISKPAINWEVDAVKITPHIFDYNHKEITNQFDQNTITYDFYSTGQVDNNDEIIFELNSNIINNLSCGILTKKDLGTISKDKYFHYIIKIAVPNAVAIITNEENNDVPLEVTLTTYCPIAFYFDNKYISIDGDNKITYDSSGTNPSYYKTPHALYYLNDDNKLVKDEAVQWSIRLGAVDSKNAGDIARYYPKIDSQIGILTVPSMFIYNNDPQVSLLATVDNEVVWCQPLYISQQLYSSTFLNTWDGSLVVDDGSGTIMSTMVGAGYKDTDNLFNGILMGKLGNDQYLPLINNKTTDTGLFGYNQNVPSFGFTIDGTAFLGRTGSGQIIFDGQTGIIKSGNYNGVNAGTLLDLETGSLIGYNFNLQAIRTINNVVQGKIIINSEAHQQTEEEQLESKNISSDGWYPLIINNADTFRVDWDGSMFSTSGRIGGWHISPLGLFSDEIQIEDRTFEGIALYGEKPNESDDPLRVFVGSVSVKTIYYIDFESTPPVYQDEVVFDEYGHEVIEYYDENNDPVFLTAPVLIAPGSLSGIWTELTEDDLTYEGITYNTIEDLYNFLTDPNFNNENSPHLSGYIDPTVPVDSTKQGVSITKKGKLWANDVSFPIATIGKLDITGGLNIKGGSFVYKGITYSYQTLTVLTGAMGGNEKFTIYRKMIRYLGISPSNAATPSSTYTV